MSEVNLLAFGCVVTFIAVAGVYVYFRESFLRRERSTEALPAEASQPGVRELG